MTRGGWKSNEKKNSRKTKDGWMDGFCRTVTSNLFTLPFLEFASHYDETRYSRSPEVVDKFDTTFDPFLWNWPF